MPDDRPVRASDEDRERVVAALKEHCAAGRLTLDELPGRVERAYAATTVSELADLTADLPGRPSARREAASPPRSRKGPMMPGVMPFSETLEIGLPPVEVETTALRQLAPLLGRYGFALVSSDRRTLTFERSGYIRTQRVQLTLDSLAERRTRLTVHGSAPLSIRRAFAELRY